MIGRCGLVVPARNHLHVKHLAHPPCSLVRPIDSQRELLIERLDAPKHVSRVAGHRIVREAALDEARERALEIHTCFLARSHRLHSSFECFRTLTQMRNLAPTRKAGKQRRPYILNCKKEGGTQSHRRVTPGLFFVVNIPRCHQITLRRKSTLRAIPKTLYWVQAVVAPDIFSLPLGLD